MTTWGSRFPITGMFSKKAAKKLIGVKAAGHQAAEWLKGRTEEKKQGEVVVSAELVHAAKRRRRSSVANPGELGVARSLPAAVQT